MSVLVIALVSSIVGYMGSREYIYRFSAAVLKTGEVQIYPKDSFDDLAKMLEEQDYIKSAAKFKTYAAIHEMDSVRVGNYKLEQGESYRTIITRLYKGRQAPIRLTFNYIRTLDKLAEHIGKKTMISGDEFAEFFRKDAQQSGDKPNYIARFMPNTYEVYWTITPAEFAELMKKHYDEFWDSNDRRDRAEDLGFTPEQVMTLASIVIEETKAEKEMSSVAGVYINRIAKKMPLQADPTVKFAVGDFSLKRILSKHLRIDSPYNTYKNQGLPPGPICSPALVAIDAVLDYGDNRHDWLYFCANSDFSGTHVFAKTLSQHNVNARAYHKALNARGIR